MKRTPVEQKRCRTVRGGQASDRLVAFLAKTIRFHSMLYERQRKLTFKAEKAAGLWASGSHQGTAAALLGQLVGALTVFAPHGFDRDPQLRADGSADNPRTLCACQPVAAMISLRWLPSHRGAAKDCIFGVTCDVVEVEIEGIGILRNPVSGS